MRYTLTTLIAGFVLSLLACTNYDPALDAPDAGEDKGIVTSPKGIITSPPVEDIGGGECLPEEAEAGRCNGGGGGTGGGNGPQPGDRCARPPGQPPAGPYGEVCQLDRNLQCVCWALPAPPVAAEPEASLVRPDCDLYPWDARCSPDGNGGGGGGGGGTGGGGYGGGTAPMTCTGGRIWVSGFGCASPYWGQHCTMNGQEFGCAYSVWGLCECFP